MARPIRIAVVVAATAVLMTTAGFGVSAIQQAVAEASSTSVVSADGPVLLGGTAADVAAASSVLGPITRTPLPSIKKILKNAPSNRATASGTRAPASATVAQVSAPTRVSHEKSENEGRDD